MPIKDIFGSLLIILLLSTFNPCAANRESRYFWHRIMKSGRSAAFNDTSLSWTIFPNQNKEIRDERYVRITQRKCIGSHQRYCNCGLSNRSGRIVNGTEASPHEFPWMASVHKRGSTLRRSFFICGATIINEHFALTAAHCVHFSYRRLRSWELFVRFGDHDTKIKETPQFDIRPSRIIVHEDYVHWKWDYNNDIALIQFTRRIPFSTSVRPICLPTADSDHAGEIATIAGWGQLFPRPKYGTSNRTLLPDKLQKLDVPLIDTERCRNDSNYSKSEITENMLCAGFMEGDQDACTGDSGGSLMMPDDNGRYTAIGIVSWGQSCAVPGFPGVYTRLGRYLRWIKRKTDRYSCFCY